MIGILKHQSQLAFSSRNGERRHRATAPSIKDSLAIRTAVLEFLALCFTEPIARNRDPAAEIRT